MLPEHCWITYNCVYSSNNHNYKNTWKLLLHDNQTRGKPLVDVSEEALEDLNNTHKYSNIMVDNKFHVKSIGWIICSFSCLIWIIMGIKDKDIPRTLMEVMYFVIGIRATINWLDFS